jgi:putative endonuclease
MANHNDLGIKGEKKATFFLEQNGYSILEHNWRYHKNEIDIIAKKGQYIVVVEVKTRSTDYFDEITQVVSNKQKRFLIEAINNYIEEKNINLEVRFDIIFIVDNKIEHFENAFNPFDFV